MMTRQHRRRGMRGFTLIELVVGLSVSLMIAAGVMDVYAFVRRQMVRGRQSTEMTRNGRAVMAYVTSYLRMAGTGMPHKDSYNVDPQQPANSGFLLGSANKIHGPVIVANAHSFGVVGDFVRPDSNFNGLSTPAHAEGYQRYNSAGNHCPDALSGQLDDNNDYTNHTTVINELSGGCLAGSGCDTRQSSLVLPNYGVASCSATADGSGTCSAGNGVDCPTCPWSLKKYRKGEYFLIVFPNSLYINRQLETSAFPGGAPPWTGAGSPFLHTHCDDTAANGEYPGISMFFEAWGGGSTSDEWVPYASLNLGWTTDGVGKGSMVYPINRGWLSTPERVFFRHNTTNKRLEYLMCWGPFAQNDTWWQGGSTATTIEGSTATNAAVCGLAAGRTGDTSDMEGGTGWQNLAENVVGFDLKYYDSDNTEISTPPGKTYAGATGLDAITRVGVGITLQRTTSAHGTIKVKLNTSIQLRARRYL
ncbi:MAG: prepilin-type N-terminal cleavage/methylation domain-containing protein [Deltaproteobacteria bacterium]|nr:prepilin-type N-terminal cleavage/methylation domain-containing protein [Deltaproteobacteria bacterium]